MWVGVCGLGGGEIVRVRMLMLPTESLSMWVGVCGLGDGMSWVCMLMLPILLLLMCVAVSGLDGGVTIKIVVPKNDGLDRPSSLVVLEGYTNKHWYL